MEIENLYHCIDKYLSGEATQFEINQVDTWYDSFDELPGFSLKEREDVEKSGRRYFLFLKNLTGADELLLSDRMLN